MPFSTVDEFYRALKSFMKLVYHVQYTGEYALPLWANWSSG